MDFDKLNPISKWFKRHLSPEVKRLVRIGYLNENLARTKAGATFLLNFLEDKYASEIHKLAIEIEKELEEEDE